MKMKNMLMRMSLVFCALFSFTTAQAAIVTINGDTTGAPTWNRVFAGSSFSTVCTACSFNVFAFSVDQTGDYDLEIIQGTFDTYLHLYNENGFDPTDQLTGLMADDDDGGAGLLSRISTSLSDDATLTAGLLYYVVVSAFSNNDFGAYTLQISGPGNITLGTSAVPLPAAIPLFLSGLVGLGVMSRRKRKLQA